MVEADQILERILDSNTSFEFGGVRDHRFGGNLLHFRGIPYATIPERFAKPILATSWREHGPSFTEYGALCPQPAFPVESSMCIPPNHGEQNGSEGADIKFDEFTCCNLNVTCPEIRGATASASRSRSKWPVYVWIHGGGQSVSFPSAQNRLGDPGPLVAQSIEMNKPIILVTVNYRLNIFGFGDPDGVNVNLGMQDQATAVRWVQDYIYLFGGDPENITIGGQSAGAIYTHGLLAMNVRPKRAILASGSLYLTAPQDRDRCFKVFRWIEQSLRSSRAQTRAPGAERSIDVEGTEWLLRTAPPEDMIDVIQSVGFYSWWMFDSSLGNWTDDIKVFGNVEEAVLLSDCKDEGAPYDSRLRLRTKKEQINAFQSISGSEYAALANAYGFEAAQDDHEKWATVVRNFVNDARYALWTQELWRRINSASDTSTATGRGTGVTCKAYLCFYDEVNPFGPWPSLGYPVAHHAVDLLATFGGYDDKVNIATKEAGRLLRGKWIKFINGEEPWPSDMIYCIGPDGQNGPIPAAEELDLEDQSRSTTRRRQANFQVLKKIGIDSLTRIWQKLLPTVGVDS